MRLLYLTDNGSVHNRRFLEKLAAAGHEICFWNLSQTETPNSSLPATLLAQIKNVVSRQSVPAGSQPGDYLKLLPQLRSLLTDFRPHLVHAGPVQSAGYLAAIANFHPLLIMSWGSDLLADADRNQDLSKATAETLSNADALFCDSDAVREKAISFRDFPESRIVQFPWGITPGVFSSDGPRLPAEKLGPFARKPGTITLIYTRSYNPLYCSDVLLEGFQKAHTANPSLRLLLLGLGSQHVTVLNYIRHHRLEAAVFPAGAQPEQDLPVWFRAADAYISCARSDGTSISLLEAMATGLPVIVTDLPSNREWVTEPANGFLAVSGSPDSVAEKISKVASLTPAERQSISKQNQRLIAQKANWDKNFHKLLQMYAHLVPELSPSFVS